MARQGEELQRVLGVPSEVWLGPINLDWNQPELGRGSDASVHRAEYAGTQVAVKVLHSILIDPGNTERRAFLQRFGGECRILRRLAHPRVIRLIGVGMAPNASPCLVVELMGNSLASRVGADPPDAFAQSLTYFLDMGEGLRFLHSHGLSHRDLKPENVLITAGRAKIADVGLARYLRRDGALNPTALTRCPGTLPFMSPESLAANPVYDLKHDIFSGGVTILSVLGGRAPAPTEPRVVQLPGGTHQAIPELQRRRGDLDRLAADHPMRNLIVSCLQDDPALRPSAESLHVQLMEIPRSYTPNNQVSIGTVVTQLESVLRSLEQQSGAISQLAERVNATDQRMAAMEDQFRADRQGITETQHSVTQALQGIARTQQAVDQVQETVATTDRRVSSMETQLAATHQAATRTQHATTTTDRRLSGLEEQLRIATEETQRNIADIRHAVSHSQRSAVSALGTDTESQQAPIAQTLQPTAADSRQSSTASDKVNPSPGGRPRIEPELLSPCCLAASPSDDLIRASHERTAAGMLARCERVFMKKTAQLPGSTRVRLLPDSARRPCHLPCVHGDFMYTAMTLVGPKEDEAYLFRHPLASGHDAASWTSVSLPTGQWHWQCYFFARAGFLYAILVPLGRTGSYKIYCTSDFINWLFVSELPENMYNFSAHVHSIFDHLFIVGGDDGSWGAHGGRKLKSVHRMDLSSPANGWVAMPPLPRASVHPEVVTVGNFIHCVGVRGDSTNDQTGVLSMALRRTSSSEQASQRWVTGMIPDTPVSHCGAAAVNGHLLIVGGQSLSDRKDVTSVFVYLEETKKWMPLPPLSTAVRQPRCVVWNNAVYSIGDRDSIHTAGFMRYHSA